jgi:23S rRNA (pseudouridine1915-N3)-methyltransferase
MRLHLIQNGRLRDPHLLALRDEYCKRFRRFGALTILEREPRGAHGCWQELKAWKVLVDEHGEQWSSPEFARRLETWSMQHGDIAFAIGAAEGHDPATRAAADCCWSLGSLVLPHQLAHLLVVEQCYRAATILAGLPYHKA